MATGKQSAKQPAESAGLKEAVKEEVKQATHEAETGNVATVKQTDTSLPTGARRSHPA